MTFVELGIVGRAPSVLDGFPFPVVGPFFVVPSVDMMKTSLIPIAGLVVVP